MRNTEQAVIEFLANATVEDVICIRCQMYQQKYHVKPSFIAVNIAVAKGLKSDQLCAQLVGFTPLAGQRDDAHYLMLGDEYGNYKEFL
jgi:hypothetical protein